MAGAIHNKHNGTTWKCVKCIFLNLLQKANTPKKIPNLAKGLLTKENSLKHHNKNSAGLFLIETITSCHLFFKVKRPYIHYVTHFRGEGGLG